ncbi:MAG: hypothetical protein RL094_796 [Candidatus Parcubacteria bacterium]|jgi:A/G-specific adenine glycosylase
MTVKIPPKKAKDFSKKLYAYYSANKRSFAWRETTDPYKILVSELMLQQTQTSRVVLKYESFLKKFPTPKALATASLTDVLREWQGLGYNRRALYLKKTAETVVSEYKGKFPTDYNQLLSLPGIGQSTAGALMAFAFNTAVPFIETNIRTVFIHFFFNEISAVTDKMLVEAIEQTIDKTCPRDWYYALYDYGTMLKAQNKQMRTLHQKSAHYKKQSKFEGSNRQIRSYIVKAFLAAPKGTLTLASLAKNIDQKADVIAKNLITMTKEGILTKKGQTWSLA